MPDVGATVHSLTNVFWHSLTGVQAKFAVGAGGARRYAPGFSPILGFAEPAQPDFDAINPYCEPSERFYCAGWTGAAPRGWTIEATSTMHCMLWDGGSVPEEDGTGIDVLGTGDAAAAVDLARLTRPGPFGPRTLELGTYLGIRDAGHLLAMAGERTHVAEFREISGVCTHPDAQGRGIARRLMHLVIGAQIARGQLPFLHVMHDNAVAHEFYLGMGFIDLHEIAVRIVSRD